MTWLIYEQVYLKESHTFVVIYRTFYKQESLINPNLKINNQSMYFYKQNLPYNLIFVNEIIFFEQ